MSAVLPSSMTVVYLSSGNLVSDTRVSIGTRHITRLPSLHVRVDSCVHPNRLLCTPKGRQEEKSYMVLFLQDTTLEYRTLDGTNKKRRTEIETSPMFSSTKQ